MFFYPWEYVWITACTWLAWSYSHESTAPITPGDTVMHCLVMGEKVWSHNSEILLINLEINYKHKVTFYTKCLA